VYVARGVWFGDTVLPQFSHVMAAGRQLLAA
jgi:hypothetical protein